MTIHVNISYYNMNGWILTMNFRGSGLNEATYAWRQVMSSVTKECAGHDNVKTKRWHYFNEIRWPIEANPDSKVRGASMGPTWGRQDPDGPHVVPMNLAVWEMNSIPFNEVRRSIVNMCLSVKTAFAAFKTQILEVSGRASRALFPLIRGTRWRNIGCSTWNSSRSEHCIRL